MAFWCKGCSADGEGDTVACVGCAEPPCIGSVIRVGHHAAYSAPGGAEYAGIVYKIGPTWAFFTRPDGARSSRPLRWMYACEEPERKSEPEVVDRATVTA